MTVDEISDAILDELDTVGQDPAARRAVLRRWVARVIEEAADVALHSGRTGRILAAAIRTRAGLEPGTGVVENLR